MSTTPGFCTAFSDYITEMKRSGEEQRAFAKGWDAAMKFMSSPRMPSPSTGTPLPTAPATGEPLPLVAFYTDAP